MSKSGICATAELQMEKALKLIKIKLLLYFLPCLTAFKALPYKQERVISQTFLPLRLHRSCPTLLEAVGLYVACEGTLQSLLVPSTPLHVLGFYLHIILLKRCL